MKSNDATSCRARGSAVGRRQLRSILIGATAALCLAGTPAAVGKADPVPIPQNDPFYTPPSGWESTAPGTILKSRPVEVASMRPTPADADAWQLLYRTTDNAGRPITTVTTVLRPRTGQVAGLITYQPAEDASAPQCAPSYALRQGAVALDHKYDASLDFLQIDQMLSSGHAISVPDWEGSNAATIVPKQPGYTALDGVRAAEAFTPLGLSGTATPVAAAGYSGGSLASAWIAQLQPTYAPEVRLVGVARGGGAGGPSEPLAPYLLSLDGGPFSGFLVSLLPGMMRADSRVATAFDTYLTPAGKALMTAGETECSVPLVEKYPFLHMDDYLTIPFSQVFDQAQPFFDETDYGITAPTIPTFLYHAVNDEIVHITFVDQAVANWCTSNPPITYTRDQLSEHPSLAVAATTSALHWIDDRLAGHPAPNNCTIRTVPSMALDGA
ncbi:lipase [Nocardia yunnanensis]|uniref:Lipase n=1 Tax=Nocardia yunnanensis TaxID=2382165 RepID=A0A386ZPF4_9NOCA|nr:lipase family protein [Nocardia yunnanensis]AYF78445.1 lipase [Nocardia yunnanensis]